MTKSEAIKELRNIRPKGGIIPQKRAEAIDIAIEVLEKEISRGQYHCEDCLHLIDRTEGPRGAISGICELRNWRGRRAGRTTACKKLKKGAK